MDLNFKLFWKNLSTPAIGFSAVLSNGIYLGDHQAIKYDRVLTKYGNGYGKCSGHSTAPLKGLYMFSCTAMAKNGHDVSVAMVKNDQIMMLAYSNPTAWESGAITVVLAMKKGDKVWIRRYGHGREINGHYKIFSGYLISEKI